jgi:hypothetical protein
MGLCSDNRASWIIHCWMDQLLSQFDRQVMCFWMNLLPVCVCVCVRAHTCMHVRACWRPYLRKCKTRFLPSIWCLNMWADLKFACEALNQTAPKQAAINQTTQNQTKACIAKSSCIDKRENRGWLQLFDTVFFLWTVPVVWSFKRARCFRSQRCCHLQAKRYLTW